MRIVYFGTSPFAVPAFEALLSSPEHDVVGVVSQPDRPSGRGMQLSMSPVKKAALELAPHLPLLQPEKARTREFREAVGALGADVFVVAAFGQILSQRLLDTPRYGGINIHGSLLPRWRGAAPMQYCLIAGDAETGVTTIQMDAGMDTGDILLSKPYVILPDDTVESLERNLSSDGAALILETLSRLEAGDCPRIKQDDALVTYSPMLTPESGYLDFAKPAQEIVNLMRGVTPRPGAFIGWAGKRIKVWRAESLDVDESGAEPGEILKTDQTGIIVCAGGRSAVKLMEIQPESKARLSASEWSRGARAVAGMRLEILPRTEGNESK